MTASLVVTGTPTSYEVTLEQTNRPWLFVLDAAVDKPVLPGFQSMMQPDLQWLVNKPVTELVRYKAQSYTSFKHGPDKLTVGLREFVETRFWMVFLAAAPMTPGGVTSAMRRMRDS